MHRLTRPPTEALTPPARNHRAAPDVLGRTVTVRPTDTLRRLRGVGGHGHVFTRRVDRFAIGDHGLDDFELEIGEMNYGFQIGGILGMDFLRAAGAVIDLDQLTITFA